MFSKLLIFFFVFLGICRMSDAQKILTGGVYAGANVSKLNAMTLSKSPSKPFSKAYEWTPSYNFGAYMDVRMAPRLYFEIGANVISKKSVSKLPKDYGTLSYYYYDGENFTIYNKNYKLHVDHKTLAIQFPLSLHVVVFQKNNFKANVYAGLYMENIISHKITQEPTGDWKPDNPPDKILEEAAKKEKTFTYGYSRTYDLFTKNNIGSIFGLGLNYKKVGIDLGMNNPIRQYEKLQFKNQSWLVNLRYQF